MKQEVSIEELLKLEESSLAGNYHLSYIAGINGGCCHEEGKDIHASTNMLDSYTWQLTK